MNIHSLRSALMLAQKLNFTRTAEALNIVQPALSRKIQQLEEEIGAPIFKRNKRNVELTPAGLYFIQEVEQIIKQLERVVDRTVKIHRGEAGELRIGFTHSVMQSILPGIIKKIRQGMPELKTILHEMNNRDQYLALQKGELDVGFCTNPLVPGKLKSRVIQVDHFVLLLPKNHPVDAENFTDLSVLAEEDFIFPSPSDGPNYVRMLESMCLDAGFQPKIIHETDSATTSFRLVEAGLGVSFEPLSSVKWNDLPVKLIELPDLPQKAALTMIWSPKLEVDYPDLFELLQE
ncbi:MAG: LysR family transcriptional regulator [Bacteroidota bacterium]